MRKLILISAIVLILTLLGLATPWYPVRTPYQVTSTETETLTQTYQYATTTYSDQTVYSKDSITIQPSSGSSYWNSPPFHLDAGSSVYVTMNMPTSCACIISVYQASPPYNWINYTLNGIPFGLHAPGTTPQYNLTVPWSSSYSLGISQLSSKSATFSGITVVESLPEISQILGTSYATQLSVGMIAAYSSINIAPSSVIGFLPSTMILLLVGVVVLFVVLFDQGIISISRTNRVRRRRRASKSVKRNR